jgi:hypothetical protein
MESPRERTFTDECKKLAVLGSEDGGWRMDRCPPALHGEW